MVFFLNSINKLFINNYMEFIGRVRGWNEPSHGNRFASLAVTVLSHAVAVIVLLQYEPARSAFTHAMPIMVSLIAPQTAPEKPLVPPKPLPLKGSVRPQEQRQITTATTEGPAPAQTPTAPAPVAAAPQQPLATTAIAPVIPPNFNADYLDNPPPAYPPLSRRIGEQGKVILRVLVNAAGRADQIELKSSSGSSRLDDAALDGIKRWRFVPARQGDQPVPAWVLIPITFSLKG